MERPRSGGSPVKYLLWLIPLLALLVLWNQYSRAPQQAADSSQEMNAVQRLHLKAPQNSGTLRDDFVPASPQLRAQVLQNLNEFRAAYRQLAPGLEVLALPGLDSRQLLAERLGSALAFEGLGQAKQADLTLEDPSLVPAPMLIRCARKDSHLVQRLLEALSPYLAGDVLIQFDDNIRVGELKLYLLGRPRFSKEGVAVFESRD